MAVNTALRDLGECHLHKGARGSSGLYEVEREGIDMVLNVGELRGGKGMTGVLLIFAYKWRPRTGRCNRESDSETALRG